MLSIAASCEGPVSSSSALLLLQHLAVALGASHTVLVKQTAAAGGLCCSTLNRVAIFCTLLPCQSRDGPDGCHTSVTRVLHGCLSVCAGLGGGPTYRTSGPWHKVIWPLQLIRVVFLFLVDIRRAAL
jgi:hypothetical protein